MGVSFSGVSGDVPVAVLDANVLYPAQLCDLLMRLAVSGLFRAHWSETIHKEWIRNLARNRADLSWEDLSRTRRLMDTALPDACVEGHRTHIPKLSLPDPGDRHVLAAAIEIEASYIVTRNLKDFPRESLGPYGITACAPAPFIMMLYEPAPENVVGVVRQLRTSLSNPPQTPQQLLDHFQASGLTETAQALTGHTSQI